MPLQSPEQRMIATQADLISTLNARVARLQREADRDAMAAERYRRGYEFYMAIQNACAEHPLLAEEWHSFIALMALTLDPTPALTMPEHDRYTMPRSTYP